MLRAIYRQILTKGIYMTSSDYRCWNLNVRIYEGDIPLSDVPDYICVILIHDISLSDVPDYICVILIHDIPLSDVPDYMCGLIL